MEYMARLIDDEIERYLNIMGAILVVGPKWCGKTTTSTQFAKSVLKLQDPDKRKSYLQLAEIKPSKLLEGDKPRLIDEWQIAPVIWDAVRTSVDDLDGKGLYILTGSTVVNDEEIMHSGTGRIHRMLMYPMSLYESKDSNGKISLKDLFEDKNLNIDGIESDLSFEDLLHVTCRGGWPETLTIENKVDQLEISKSYVENICQTDVSEIDNVKRDPAKIKLLLSAYARNLSTLAKNVNIIKDVNSTYTTLDETTYYSYISALKRLFVIDDIRGWSPNIRSKTVIRTGPKRQFIDPSIATAILNLTPEKLIYDLNTFGFIFENLCIRDLKIYSQPLNGTIYYYHDRLDLEVDCVIQLDNGDYGFVEFKLGDREEEKGAKNLLKIAKIIEKKRSEKQTNIPEPSFLAIVTGGKFAYTRKDGVKVIPIACLKN
ncbi:MAG: ATP-binding protein [Methanosphaera stadtmanae]|nr:ATP-binding protein [Methanosphaera stadtmanae]